MYKVDKEVLPSASHEKEQLQQDDSAVPYVRIDSKDAGPAGRSNDLVSSPLE